jgi:hypothetical protein
MLLSVPSRSSRKGFHDESEISNILGAAGSLSTQLLTGSIKLIYAQDDREPAHSEPEESGAQRAGGVTRATFITTTVLISRPSCI